MKAVFVYFLKMFFRNRRAFFASIIIPILFLVLFGFLFGEEENRIFKVGIYPTLTVNLEKSLKGLPLTYTIYKDTASLKGEIEKGKIDIGIELDKDSITFYYNKGNLKDVPVIKGMIGTITARYEDTIHSLYRPFILRFHTIEIGKVHTNSLGYLIPGIISMSILSLGMFSIIEAFSRYKKLGLLKRFSVTPLSPFSFMGGIVLGRLVIGIGIAWIIYFLSKVLFGIDFSVNIFLFIISILIAGVSMSGFGALIALIFKEANTAANIGSILFTVMLFFSGIYFPLNLLPKGARVFSYIFPLTYVAQNMRYAMGVEYINYRFFIYSNLLLLGGGILLLLIVSKKYMERGM